MGCAFAKPGDPLKTWGVLVLANVSLPDVQTFFGGLWRICASHGLYSLDTLPHLVNYRSFHFRSSDR
jgi:hypothetical protein